MIDVGAFREKWSFLAQKEVFIACSGGLDSMVLTHLLKNIPAKLTLLHVNYKLRGKESQGDQEFVQHYASRERLGFALKSVDLKGNRGNLQQNARDIRYAWFAEQVKPHDILFLGHHQDDQLETFYLNLARKSGNAGMACMTEIQGNIMRPLLDYSKKDLYTFALENKISWREDSSNKSNKYRRNLLRNEILPFLEQEIPGLRDSILTLIPVFQENRKHVEKSVEELIADIRKTSHLYLEIWRDLTVEQRISILKSFGYASKQLPEIEKLATAQKGKSVSLQEYTIIREENSFYFKKRASQTKKPILEVSKVIELPTVFNKDVIFLDAAKISGKLKIRTWKKGDRMTSVGMEGSKLISDIITDAKVPHAFRKEVLILEDEREIYWCVGLKIGKAALANESSKEILCCKIIY